MNGTILNGLTIKRLTIDGLLINEITTGVARENVQRMWPNE